MDDDAVKNFIPFRVSAEEPLFEVGCIQSVVFGDFIAVRVDPFPTVDAGGDRIVFAMIMQLYPLDADRLVEVGNFYLRRVVRASRPLADREAIAFASWFTHPMTFAHCRPSYRAFSTPVEVPPAPQNKSMYSSFISPYFLVSHSFHRRAISSPSFVASGSVSLKSRYKSRLNSFIWPIGIFHPQSGSLMQRSTRP